MLLPSVGLRFSNWYSSSPVCSPSRASLLTGRYPQRTGVSRILRAHRDSPGLYEDEVTIAKALQVEGYRTGCFGKWHLGSSMESRPNQQGFEEFRGFLAGCVDYYSHIMYWEMGAGVYPVHDLWHNNEEIWENGTYMTDIITRESSHFINEHAEEPFFLYVSYSSPHYPMHGPREFWERYSHLESHRQQQAAMVSTVDESIGKIMATLEAKGLIDDTVIYFQSDNGATIEERCLLDDSGELYHGGSNDGYRGWKGGLFEGGIHMPAIISAPGYGVPEGKVCDEVGCAIDILPTFLGLAKVELPQEKPIDGSDIMPMVKEGADTPHEMLFWLIGKQLAVRSGKWKLTLNVKESFEDCPECPDVFLVDLEKDPEEKVNLSDSEPELTKKLTAILKKWNEEVNTKS